MIPRRHRHDDAEALHEALESRTPARGEVAELVRTAEVLCEAAAVQPSLAFRTSLREQLMAEADRVLVPAAPRTPRSTTTTAAPVRSGRRRLAGLATAAVVSVGAVGLVSSSATAVPGDALYSVKRGVENVELALQRNDADRGAYQLERAAARLDEAAAILEGPAAKQSAVADVLGDFTEQAEDGSARLFDTYTVEESTASVEKVNDFTATAALGLGELSAVVPPEAADSFQSAAATVRQLVAEAARLCGSCSTTDTSDLVGAVSAVEKPTAQLSEDTAEAAAPAAQPTQRSVEVQPTAPRPSATTPDDRPAPPTPSPTPTTTPPPNIVTAVTKPIVGALLGSEEQTGLVPGLLGGLLGGTKK